MYPVVVKKFATENKADPLVFSFYRDLFCFPLLFLCALIAERKLLFPRIRMLIVSQKFDGSCVTGVTLTISRFSSFQDFWACLVTRYVCTCDICIFICLFVCLQLLYIVGVYWAGPEIASAFQPIIPVWTTIIAIVTCTEKFPSPLYVSFMKRL